MLFLVKIDGFWIVSLSHFSLVSQSFGWGVEKKIWIVGGLFVFLQKFSKNRDYGTPYRQSSHGAAQADPDA
jgi:hypothetical protein